MAVHPYGKIDIFKGELHARERLEPARASLRLSISLLEQFIDRTEQATDLLSDEQLEVICKAAWEAQKAAENCALMGYSDFNAHPLEKVEWVNR